MTELAAIIRHDASARWERASVLNGLQDGAGDMFEQLAADSHCLDSAGGQEFLRQLAGVIGAKNDSGEVNTVLDYLQRNVDSGVAFLLTRALGDGLRNAGTSLARADSEGKLKPTFVRAKAMASDAKVSQQIRVQAIQLLAMSSFDNTGEE